MGAEVSAGEGKACFRIAGVEADGTRLVEPIDGSIAEAIERHGLPPLPPYIAHHGKPGSEDRERYQTVYARTPGSIAAPTAGLHFTPGLLERLRVRGVEVHALTMHVGAATFRPIKTARVEDHVLPSERVEIPESVARAVNAARDEGRRIVAVGTTTTRALESAAGADDTLRATAGRADVFIVPGYRFRVVDALLTNFHLPRSSLLVLVSAFAGRELILEAYRHALTAGYRFYSYGDATLIV
jgi:S-adenosylmethionine:tRNA ribosyltransferase-isomerase